MARIRWNLPQIDLTARTHGGNLVRRVTDRVESGAKALAPRGTHLSGSGKTAAGPPLQESIYSRLTVNSRTALGRVGAKARHAETVHQGSQAHVIRSRGGRMLKFRWDRGDFLVAARSGRRGGNKRTGRFHFFARVHHPGNKNPVRYLTTPLSFYGRANGFLIFGVGRGRSRLP